MASWLMAVNRVGRDARSWSYIEGPTCNYDNAWKRNNVGCMLYSVYAWTWCQLIIMAWRDREQWLHFVFCDDGSVVDEKGRDGGWKWKQCRGTWESRGTICLIELGRYRMGVIRCQVRTCTYLIRHGKSTCTWNSLKSQFFMMICPISSHLSLSRPQLYHHLRTPSDVIPLYHSMPWSGVNTMYSILRVQHTQSTAYTEYCIHRVQHTPSTLYTEYSIHRVLHTPSTASTEYCICHVLLTPDTLYTEDCMHRIVHHPKIDSHPLPASLLALSEWCYTQFSTFPQLQVTQRIESELP